MSQIAKAKTAKLSKYPTTPSLFPSSPLTLSVMSIDLTFVCLVRTLIDYFPPSSRDLQMQVTNDNITWAREEKRVFLRQSLEIKLVGL